MIEAILLIINEICQNTESRFRISLKKKKPVEHESLFVVFSFQIILRFKIFIEKNLKTESRDQGCPGFFAFIDYSISLAHHPIILHYSGYP